MAQVVIADDHVLFRDGIRRVLESRGVAVIGEVGDGLQVLDLVERVKPDVLLLDLALPGLHGLDILREVSRRAPQTRVLVVSGDGRNEFVVEALRNGAAGYLVKSCSATELVEAIATVAQGRTFVSHEVSAALTGLESALSDAGDVYGALTHREREVFHLMAEGMSNSAVGARLSVSPRTVETHRAHILRKLGLKTQTDVVLFAVRRGLIHLNR